MWNTLLKHPYHYLKTFYKSNPQAMQTLFFYDQPHENYCYQIEPIQ